MLTMQPAVFAALGSFAVVGAPPPLPSPAPDRPPALLPAPLDFSEAVIDFDHADYESCVRICDQIVGATEPGPSLEPVHWAIAAARIRQGDQAQAAEALRRYLELYPRGARSADAQLALAQALVATNQANSAAIEIQDLLEGGIAIDDYGALLKLALADADALTQTDGQQRALALLQSATRERIVGLQRQRVASLTALPTASQGRPVKADDLSSPTDDSASRLKIAEAALADLEKDREIDLRLLLREAKCYFSLDQPWEAAVVDRDLLDRFPKAADRVYVLQGLILARQATHRSEEALALCQRFLAEYRAHALAPEIALIGATLAESLHRAPDAVAFLEFAAESSRTDLRPFALYSIGRVKFAARDWVGARVAFDRYLKEFPADAERENAIYQSALTWLATGDYPRAETALHDFMKLFPASVNAGDATYRLAVCRMAAHDYAAVLQACEAWPGRFPEDSMIDGVLSLKGDALAALHRPDEAFAAYREAAKLATSDEVLKHALEGCARHFETKKDWDGLIGLFEAQLQRAPASPLALGWIRRVAEGNLHAGRLDQAWKTVAARVSVALDDPANDEVENLLGLMAQIQTRRSRLAAADPSPRAPAELPVTAAALGVELKVGADPAPLTFARLVYFEAKCLQLGGKASQADQLLRLIADKNSAESLSAALLAEVGEALRKDGAAKPAGVFFETLIARFPASDYLDYAYVNRGQAALEQGDATAALDGFTAALERTNAVHLRREATVGQARAFFELGRLDEAAKLFEAIAATREWHGESTALSLYYLGQIAVRQGDLPKGIAFFQRVYVGQQLYSDWVARSYLESGRAFEQLGRRTEAIATYREMLADQRLQARPESDQARDRLKSLDST
jgi:TolA-binding protein